MKIDPIDKKILRTLQKNAKITNAKLSKEIGLSPAPTLERVRKLESKGIISGYHAKLDKSKIGLGVSTYVMVSLKGHNKKNLDSFIEKISDVDNIVECHHITGSGDFILKVVAKDIESYQKLMLEKVSEIEVTDSLQSMVILSTFKDNKQMPLLDS
jgi:DNA-binding Lrp family transcriptional regulator